jgi:hypothetical protein
MDRANNKGAIAMTDLTDIATVEAVATAAQAAFPEIESCDVQHDEESISLMLDDEDTEMVIAPSGSRFVATVYDPEGEQVADALGDTPAEALTAAAAAIK